MGKGCKRRPRQTSREEEDLRMDLALGNIWRGLFDIKMKKLQKKGKIIRSGKVMR